MGWREDISNFDLGRLTIVGWLVFLLSIGAGIGAATAVAAVFPADPDSHPQRRYRLPAIAGLTGAVAFFFASKFVLNLAGISLMRPGKQEKDEGNKKS